MLVAGICCLLIAAAAAGPTPPPRGGCRMTLRGEEVVFGGRGNSQDSQGSQGSQSNRGNKTISVENLVGRFRKGDKDNSDSLDLTEFGELMERVGLSQDALEFFHGKMDVDSNGVINFGGPAPHDVTNFLAKVAMYQPSHNEAHHHAEGHEEHVHGTHTHPASSSEESSSVEEHSHEHDHHEIDQAHQDEVHDHDEDGKHTHADHHVEDEVTGRQFCDYMRDILGKEFNDTESDENDDSNEDPLVIQ